MTSSEGASDVLDLEQFRANVFASSTKRRIAELQLLHDRLTSQSLPRTQALTVLEHLLSTYPYYIDRSSRRTAQVCLSALVSGPDGAKYAADIAEHLKCEILKPILAPASTFVLLEWSSTILQAAANRPDVWESSGVSIASSLARSLERFLGTTGKDSRSHSAYTVTWRALRSLFKAKELAQKAPEEIIKALTGKGTGPSFENAPLLGAIAGVASRLPGSRYIVQSLTSDYHAFYTREIIGSRVALPDHVANGLKDFFMAFETQEALVRDVIPALEKTLLRAPEVVLRNLVPPLVLSLPTGIDLSHPLVDSILKPLLSSVRSSNPTIREGSLSAFQALATVCKDAAALSAVAHELLKSVKDAKAPEQRTVFATMLAALRLSSESSVKLANGLVPIAAKEANEPALVAQVKALGTQIRGELVAGANLDPIMTKAFADGLKDKKPTIRRIWALEAANILWQLPDELQGSEAQDFAQIVFDNMHASWSEALANPATAGSAGTAAPALILYAFALNGVTSSTQQPAALKTLDIKRHVQFSNEKLPFLFNNRMYAKLTTEDDLRWFVRALSFAADDLNGESSETNQAWAQASIFAIASATVRPSIRRVAAQSLTECYLKRPVQVGKAIIEGLWSWLRHVYIEEKDTAAFSAQSGSRNLYVVLRCISLSKDRVPSLGEDDLSHQMIRLLVLCREPLIPRVNWIDLCLRIGMDPGSLVLRDPALCLREIQDHTGLMKDAFQIDEHEAACAAAADLAFIAGETFIPLIVDLITMDLNADQLRNIGPDEAAIYRTPEGVPYFDVLSKQDDRGTVPKKSAKDYDTLKWEEELRQQIAKKPGAQRKLTPDENAKVKTQIEKESKIRDEVSQVAAHLLRGTSLVKNLARGPPTDVEAWMSSAARTLLASISQGAILVVGDAPVFAYLDLSKQIATRLGALRSSIGIATIRAEGVTRLPSEMQAEALGDIVTRVLYRLRFSCEQRPLDSVSLMYILPLIEQILSLGGVARPDADEADEQILLSLETLSFHLEIFATLNMPREHTAALLFNSMRRYTQHYKVLKDSILGISHVIAPEASKAEIAVFLQACVVPEPSVRQTALQAIDSDLALPEHSFIVEIWLACHDDMEENATIASEIWEENELETELSSSFDLIPFLESEDRQLRGAAARSLAHSVNDHSGSFSEVLSRLQELYIEKEKPRKPELDVYGMPMKKDLRDPWESRHGIAMAFRELALSFDADGLAPFVAFMIERGPLADRADAVREQMVEAATHVVSVRGGAKVEELLKVFETTLDAPDSGSLQQDKINEAVIVLYGALARHLKNGDARTPEIVERLLATLSTPSETVQYAVANCLPPLVRGSASRAPEYLARVMKQLLQGKKYADRRGAAYGLAGIVKGKGVLGLRDARIMSSLRAATEEKKDQYQRQGAFLAYELLSTMLGSVFEPYVIQIVPQLLAGFGDPNADVRDACLDASKACFSSLSSYGVKQILPTLLEGLDEVQWRSKKGACDSLGAMAYLDPQQLAVSLPEIIPPLTNVLNDSHKEVRGAANRSLQRFGEVISNPEIKSLVSVLLKALSDPTKYTDDALDSLLKVSFIHYLDAPSLALVTRILERGLGDRSNTKRKSAQLIGSLAHLTDRRDLVSHLPMLVSGLRIAAVDPVPTTRATASKALGSLVEKLGEDALPDLIPSLMSTLKTDTGAGDRLGSAQALSEVLAGLGVGRLEETLPSILQNVQSSKAAVREGFMSMFIFLPACFGNSFANYLARIIPPILAGLADEIEGIRDTALRAGRLLVKNFASRAVDLLLPELQRGLGDNSYRIRLSSVELVGDLLFNLTGISAQAEQAEEEEEDVSAQTQQSLLEVLGEEKRANILSALYISRCDTSGLVRTAAVHVWKVLVATPRTLREITPTLTQVIIQRLASSNSEQKHIAGNAMGELIRKAGDGVLASLIPTLEEGLETSTDTDAKQGICIALRELISSASIESLEEHEPKLIAVVRTALVDGNAEVRDAAADAFDSLQQLFGKKVIDHILPHLLGLLRKQDDADNALAALLTLLTEATRSNIILPNLLPTLLTPPISAFNARALASLASVAGSAMVRRLSSILNALLDDIVTCKDTERLDALDAAFDAVILSVDEYDGLSAVMSIMLGLVKHNDHRKRKSADIHFAHFFEKSELDFSRYHPEILRNLLIAFDDSDTEVVKAAWKALYTFTSKLDKESMESLVIPARQSLGQVGVAGHQLPGFLLPKGIGAILPIFLHGLVNGPPDHRVQAAFAISEIVDKTSGDALKPFVTQITGPLIRVVSERSVDVKAAILVTLNHLLEKIPTFLKPFLPQLQRTFSKALADPSSDVLRMRAAKALGTLITLTPRIDPLIGELVAGSKTPDPGVRNAMQKALFEVVGKVGKNMSEASRNAVIELVDEDPEGADEAASITNARLLGALVKNVPKEAGTSIIKSRILTPQVSRGSILAFNAILLESPEALLQDFGQESMATICKGIGSHDQVVAENSILAAGKYLLLDVSNRSFEATKVIFEALVPLMQPGSPIDARRLAFVVVRTVSRKHNDLVRPHTAMLVQPVFAGVRDMIIPIKLSAEAAFLGIFDVVEEDSAVFDKYMAGAGASLQAGPKRSMQDYFKRVAIKLAAQARERREAEGGQDGLGLSNDEREDEAEIWSVGKIDLGAGSLES